VQELLGFRLESECFFVCFSAHGFYYPELM